MPKIIFIHGLGQTQYSWNKTIAHLSKHIEIVTFNLSASCNRNEITYNDLYAAFEEYCSSISEPLNLCGISLGAVLALNYAIEHPQKVNSLFLIAPQYKMPQLLLKFQNLLFHFMPNSCFRKMEFGKRNFILLTKSMENLDFSNKVTHISCSPFIICGKKDKANLRAAKELADSIPQATLYLIENAGHEVNIDKPKELANIINCFFS